MLGKALIGIGLTLLAVGIALVYVPGLFAWFGRLPGDLSFTRGGVRVFIPLTSMIIVSVLLTLIVSLLRRW